MIYNSTIHIYLYVTFIQTSLGCLNSFKLYNIVLVFSLTRKHYLKHLVFFLIIFTVYSSFDSSFASSIDSNLLSWSRELLWAMAFLIFTLLLFLILRFCFWLNLAVFWRQKLKILKKMSFTWILDFYLCYWFQDFL